jgi:hypothetical protein
MSKRVVREYTDDYDSSTFREGQGGVFEFSIRGEHYRMRMSNGNYQKLLALLLPYMAKAERVAAPSRSGARSESDAGYDTSTVRAWARQNGYPIGDRGRIPQHILDAYAASEERGTTG